MSNPYSLRGHPMAQEVRLETSEGQLVATGRTPKFMAGQEPKIIMWGLRHFLYFDTGVMPGTGEVQRIYREAFTVALVDVDSGHGQM